MMKINSDDYVVIAKYAAPDHDWLNQVNTQSKRDVLTQFSLEVAEVFIGIGAYVAGQPARKDINT